MIVPNRVLTVKTRGDTWEGSSVKDGIRNYLVYNSVCEVVGVEIG